MALKTHVAFSVPGPIDLRPVVLAHFSRLGYVLERERPGEWVFVRGTKAATFWRFNIRAYSTTLHVRAAKEHDGETRISCDWEVWTFMSITTTGDVRTLEAEGEELESKLLA